jgi:Ca2+-binding EF-hand superfamily protein
MMGMEALSFLSDRMFQIMDKTARGKITLIEYLDYFDVMLHGTEEEKMKQSFDLLDVKKGGQILLPDFKSIVIRFAQMWSNALGGQPVSLNSQYIKNTFAQFAGQKDSFDF